MSVETQVSLGTWGPLGPEEIQGNQGLRAIKEREAVEVTLAQSVNRAHQAPPTP